MPQGRLLGAPAPARGLPRGRNSLPAAAVLDAQRQRLLRAIVAEVAERGYPAVSVADVVRRARVSRSSFYAQFADKEDCFFAATAEGRRLMFTSISAAVHDVPPGADDLETLHAGLRAFLRFLADEPAFAAVFYLELPAVGRRGVERLAAAHELLAQRTATWHARARDRHPEWPAVSADVFRALTGATEELVRQRVRAGHAEELPQLEELVMWLHRRVLS